LNYHFVYEALVAAFKEVCEFLFEGSEQKINELILVFGCELLVEIKFLNDDVEVVSESNLKIFANALAE
jgi:hypothetical protein